MKVRVLAVLAVLLVAVVGTASLARPVADVPPADGVAYQTRDEARATRDAAREHAQATREAEREQAQATREAGREQARATREAGKCESRGTCPPTPTPPPPTTEPTVEPTAVPTDVPTAEPTAVPTDVPTAEPTAVPTDVPTAEPTAVPTDVPTAEPTAVPTAVTVSWLPFGLACYPAISVTGFAPGTYDASFYAENGTHQFTEDLVVNEDGSGTLSLVLATYGLGFTGYAEVNGVQSELSAANCNFLPTPTPTQNPDAMVTVSWLPSGTFGECRPLIEVTGFTPGNYPVTLYTATGEDALSGSLDVGTDGTGSATSTVILFESGDTLYAEVGGVRSTDSVVDCTGPTPTSDPNRTVSLSWVPSNAVNFCSPAVSVTGFAPGTYAVTIGAVAFNGVLVVGDDGTGSWTLSASFGFPAGQNLFATVDGVQSATAVVSC